jgi:acetyl-CoA hydrolase
MPEVDFSAYLAPLRGGRTARWCSPEEAVRAIPEGSRIFVGANSTPPMRLLQALVDERKRWRRLELVTAYLFNRLPPFEHPGDPFHFVTLQATPAFRRLWSTGAVQVLPSRYSDMARLCGPDGPLPCDVAIVQVSPPGPEGRVSLGVTVGANIHPARTAPLVIAQVNPQVPYTFGAGELPVEEIDLLVEVDEPIIEARPAGAADPVGQAIAARAAAFVGDGATIQFGVGALPDAILAQLSDRRGLRVHSGLVSEACVDLYDAGCVEGPMVAAQVLSTARMLRWVHRNPAVLMAPASYTHGAPVLGSLRDFVALNSTVEVALDGSCNSEAAGGRLLSGPGGAPDFAFGASVASGGRSVIALRSTAAEGTVSRIVRSIEPPSPVTLPSYLADVVVTEHGAAELRGLTLEGRATALRALAHPDHRAALSPA